MKHSHARPADRAGDRPGSWEFRSGDGAGTQEGEAHPIGVAGIPGPSARESIRDLGERDIEAACELLTRLSACFAGMVSRRMSRAICVEAVRREDPLIVVAEREGSLAGLAVAVLGGPRFWRGFFMRHPGLAFRRAAMGALSGYRARRPAGPASGSGARPAGAPAWPDEGPRIAKAHFIGVAPEHRRRGVAERIYPVFFERLRARGMRRVDARIDSRNRASLRLHEAVGWTLYQDGDDVVFATRTLN